MVSCTKIAGELTSRRAAPLVSLFEAAGAVVRPTRAAWRACW